MAAENKSLRDTVDELTSLVEDNSCSICKSMKIPPPCPGHKKQSSGRGSGSGSDVQEAEDSTLEDKDNSVTANPKAEPQLDAKMLLLTPSRRFSLELLLEHFYIENDSERGILTLRAKPGLSQEAAQEFLSLINAEFEQFKTELQQQGLSVNHFSSTLDERSLIIRIPSPKHYDAFIQRLFDVNSLQKKSETSQMDAAAGSADDIFNPSPFKTNNTPFD